MSNRSGFDLTYRVQIGSLSLNARGYRNTMRGLCQRNLIMHIAVTMPCPAPLFPFALVVDVALQLSCRRTNLRRLPHLCPTRTRTRRDFWLAPTSNSAFLILRGRTPTYLSISMRAIASTAFLLTLLSVVLAVKQEDFKQCKDSSFCRRLKSIVTKQEAASAGTFKSPYSLGSPISTPETSGSENSWTWPLSTSLFPEITFELRVDILQKGDGIVRIRADEVGSETPWGRYNETAKWVLVDQDPELSSSAKLATKGGISTISYGPASAKLSLEIQHSPLKITQSRNGKAEIVINERSLFHMEHFRNKEIESQDQPETNTEGDAEQVVLAAPSTPAVDGSWFVDSDPDMFEEKWKSTLR